MEAQKRWDTGDSVGTSLTQKRDVLLQSWRGEREIIRVFLFTLFGLNLFPLRILRVSSLNHSICPVFSPISLLLPGALVRVGRTHALSATMKKDRRPAQVGHFSWRHLARRARNREMPTSLLRYSALFFITLFLSLIYPPPSVRPPPRVDLFFFPLFPLSTHRVRIVDGVVCRRFAFRLRNEAKHPTRDTCKMAEFNGKAPSCAIRRSRSR